MINIVIVTYIKLEKAKQKNTVIKARNKKISQKQADKKTSTTRKQTKFIRKRDGRR